MVKVFCIGFHKTGTSSLAEALMMLGYRVTGPNGLDDPNIADNVHRITDELVSLYDAFQDNPWPIIYRDLDKKYPKSKFILTTRDSESWIKSQVKHFGDAVTPMRQWIYGVGSPSGNEQTYIDRYERHNRDVVEYFKGRSGDLLVMDLAQGDGWDKLCSFLDKPIPRYKFPHKNKAVDRDKQGWRLAGLFQLFLGR